MKNKFAPIFYFYFYFNQRWQWPALVGEFLHQPLLATFGLSVISLSPAFTSAGLQILSSLAAYILTLLAPALACKASAGYIYISPSLAAYGLLVSSPALACKASVGSPLLAAYGLPVSSYIYIYKQIFQIHSLFLQRKSSAIYFSFLIDFPITQHEMALIPLVRSSIS